MNLPEEYRKEVNDFIDFLASKQKTVRRTSFYGALKGKLVYMADDFDAPLQEFAESCNVSFGYAYAPLVF